MDALEWRIFHPIFMIKIKGQQKDNKSGDCFSLLQNLILKFENMCCPFVALDHIKSKYKHLILMLRRA